MQLPYTIMLLYNLINYIWCYHRVWVYCVQLELSAVKYQENTENLLIFMVSLNWIFWDKKKYKNWAKSVFLEPTGRMEYPPKNLIQANFELVIKAEEHEKKLFLFNHIIRWKILLSFRVVIVCSENVGLKIILIFGLKEGKVWHLCERWICSKLLSIIWF